MKKLQREGEVESHEFLPKKSRIEKEKKGRPYHEENNGLGRYGGKGQGLKEVLKTLRKKKGDGLEKDIFPNYNLHASRRGNKSVRYTFSNAYQAPSPMRNQSLSLV
jgi:hypothetical protein